MLAAVQLSSILRTASGLSFVHTECVALRCGAVCRVTVPHGTGTQRVRYEHHSLFNVFDYYYYYKC